jgi:molybdenum cofactor synthesis domain-containing protein
VSRCTTRRRSARTCAGSARDVEEGRVVVDAGTVMQAAQIGIAAAVGLAEVPVRRRPVVLVLSTGSELVAPGTPLRPGQIYESNGPMLAAAVEEAGGVARLLRFVPDDVEEFLGRLREQVEGVDLVVTSGGVSAGAYEVVKDAFTGRGVEFVKVGMQPGRAAGGRAGRRARRRRGRDAARQPRQLAGVVRGVPAPRAAGGDGAPAPGAAGRDRHAG